MRNALHSTLVVLLFLLSLTSIAVGPQQPCQTSVAYGQKVNGRQMGSTVHFVYSANSGSEPQTDILADEVLG